MPTDELTHCADASDPEPRSSVPELDILLVEDHPVNQQLAAKVLKKEGHRVTIAATGQAAVELVRHSDFSVILMDIQMPVMDGLEATARIRQLEQDLNRHTLIIVLTAHAMKGYDQKCYTAGADGYLTKPLRPGDLKRTIQQLLSQTQPTGLDCQTAVTENEIPDCIDMNLIIEGFGDDPELAVELIDIFQEDLPSTLQQLENAVANEDLELVNRLAHSLKSPLMLFGATQARDYTHNLELAAQDASVTALGDLFQNLRIEILEVSRALQQIKIP